MTGASFSPPANESKAQSFLANGMLVVVVIALAKFAFHFYFNNRYDYFRDEFDYMACGDHLAWGYVDQPPLIPFLIHVSRAVLGDPLRSIRFIPALASSLRSEEHTSELQSHVNLVCRLLLEKKKKKYKYY